MIAADEELWGGATWEEPIAVLTPGRAHWQSQPDESLYAWVSAAGAQADVRTEGEAGEENGAVVEGVFEPVECGAHVILFAAPVIVFALA